MRIAAKSEGVMKLSSAFLKSEESIICGDMNAHSKVWGSNTSNVTGKELLRRTRK